MAGFGRLAAKVLLAMLLLVEAASAQPAERRIVPTPDADYFGHDYDILRDVDENICETACLSDNRCKAFTLNRSSGWCFLKEEVGELRQTPGALSGRIVLATIADPNAVAAREKLLPFLPASLIDEARNARLSQDGPSKDASSWLAEARDALNTRPDDWDARQDNASLRRTASISAFVLAEDPAQQAEALDVMATALGEDGEWKPAIAAWRLAVSLNADDAIARRLDEALAAHGFRIVGNSVDNNAATPRICLNFSEDLTPSLSGGDIAGDFLSVDGGDDYPVSASGSQICVEGVKHGQRYRILARAGIPAASGETLPHQAETNIYVRDRDPAAHFAGNAYVLPAGGAVSIPVTSINTDRLKLRLLRIGDRQLARTIGESTFLSQLATYQLDTIAGETGEEVWHGEMDVSGATNAETVTAIPLRDVLAEARPGVYILSAAPANRPREDDAPAQQWFVLTDIGLTTLSGADGLTVSARSLGTAEALEGIDLELVAANNEVLGQARTDAEGRAVFAPGLSAGDGGQRPAVLTASRGDGQDFVFLDMTTAPFDLTDRGVEGRAPAGPMDVFLTPDRGIYRPGDTVNLTMLVRDGEARAVEGAALTLVVTRPDGVEYLRRAVATGDAGGTAQAVDLPAAAMRGGWRMALHIDPERPAIASTSVQVQDFEPQKIDFDLPQPGPIDPQAPPELSFDVRYLFGAPAANLTVEGEIVVSAVRSLPGLSGWLFGLADEESTPGRQALEPIATDEDGRAALSLPVIDVPGTTRPVSAELIVRVTDAGGRPVERRVDVPLISRGSRLAVRPAFDGSVPQGSQASFSVALFGEDGQPVAAPGVNWVLNRVTTDFQWYSTNGRWNFEPIRRVERVADGTLDLAGGDPANLSVPVDWGGYELVVSAPDAVPASLSFNAGWYVAAGSADTPDMARLTLDKPRYSVGEEAVVRIEPRFAGRAEIVVMREGVIGRTVVDVPAGGGEARLPVTAEWGAGAYVTAFAWRPMDIEARQMPARAIGLAYAAVDPGERALSVTIEAPQSMRPRRRLDVPVQVSGVRPGERAFLTLAAVDAGILNITDFQPPSPGDWYFGQRRLGVDIRDLYSRLIDRMQGAPGSVRSGGDAGADAVSPPAMDELVSLFSGVVQLDGTGRAVVPLDIPDFDGELKLMAIAWSDTGVGQADASVTVRDPVVAQISRPLFLGPGDTSRIALDLAHADGPAGAVRYALTGGDGVLRLDGAVAGTVELAEGQRIRRLVQMTAIDEGEATLTLEMTPPDGEVLTKQMRVAVRSLRPDVVRRSSLELAAGRSLTLGQDIFVDLAPDTASATLTVSSFPGFDVAGAVRALDLYPYGCTEQLTSRVLPMLYLDETILSAGLGERPDIGERVIKAISGILANQGSSGSFGLWAPDYGDLWLDSYVTDFLSRAAAKGQPVPAEALSLALDNLANQVAYLPEKPDWASAAYAYYVLARNGRAAIGDLRYVADNRMDEFATPLARAQLAAALALYGDRLRAETVYRTAVASALDSDGDRLGRSDYGSALRDAAGVVTLGLEQDIPGTDLDPLVRKVGMERAAARYTSTQDEAWSLLAAHAIVTRDKSVLELDGERREGAYATRFDAASLAAPAAIRNAGAKALTAEITVRGKPTVALPGESAGYAIARSVYTLDGAPASLDTVAQGDRLVAVIEVTPIDRQSARLIVDDPLPAGLEIDNPSILKGGDVAALDFLDLTDDAAHTEFRADRFIASVDKDDGDVAPMRFAYIVRAVSPGRFLHPAALVENMYQPERRARTEESLVEVVGPLQ
ncbi:hypothetical protein SAMN02745911_0522 [Aureimonas altamirensis DSM 21988]|uniref:Apple domain-containing protein n=1 Tax=Aureimonas altamirensis DSM 21988 TaxID=1121026 RepID=A0ABY1I459_9HYPH|nr:alpha-2-macroglobulin family protein [Aureimonas altamirensis]SHI56343.1 hypothetical protein SAMN02745911_0522 [Aureimonas altamirensis DSM 21988]